MPDENASVSRSSYLDFELEISLGRGREYTATVVHSPAGEARETFRFPFGELELENRLQALQIALLSSGDRRRRMLSQEEQAVRDFGQELFDALIVGEVRSRYDVSLSEAVRQGKGLRLKLRIRPPGLAALPWEFLYDARQAEYVCLSRQTPIVRYLELPQPIQPVTVTLPLHILGMIASPSDLMPLDVTREKQRMEEALKDLRARGLVDLTWLEGQSWHDLQRAMRKGPWQVFHFTGHGGFDRNADEGFIALTDEEGRTHRLSATQLGRLLADHASLRLVFLNSCEGAQGSEHNVFSSTAATLMRRGISAVLAMQYDITDGAAIEFARAFYEALADGLPVDMAVVEARKAVSLAVANTVEWGVPVLYMRSSRGDLFDVQGKELALGIEREPQAVAPSLPGPRAALTGPILTRLRRLPPLAWAGLLALLLVLGAVTVWQFRRGSADLEPTDTVPVVVKPTATPTLTVTPTTPPTLTVTPTTTPMSTPTPLSCPPVLAVGAPFEEAWDSMPEIGCPTDEAMTGMIADEDFEHGQMLWSQHGQDFWGIKDADIDPILVLFDDGAWQLVKGLGWIEGDNEFTCSAASDSPDHPHCPPTPKRGFGKIWCEMPELQERLGLVIKCEAPHYESSMQKFESGFMVHVGGRELFTFHYEGPDADYGYYESR